MEPELASSTSAETHLRYIALKTAALMEAATAMGALSQAASAEQTTHLARFGHDGRDGVSDGRRLSSTTSVILLRWARKSEGTYPGRGVSGRLARTRRWRERRFEPSTGRFSSVSPPVSPQWVTR